MSRSRKAACALLAVVALVGAAAQSASAHTSGGGGVVLVLAGSPPTTTPEPVQPACVQEFSAERCDAIRLTGHRFSEYSASTTDEDTLTALKSVRGHGVRSVESDFWVNRSGTGWVWHDSDFCRVADPASLVDAGIASCTVKVNDTTDAQMALVRTKGGAPASRLTDVMKYAIAHHVHVMMEVKPGPRTVAGLHAIAKKAGNARYFTFYEAPTKTCSTALVQAYHAQGFTIGLKAEPRCPMSDKTIAAQGFSYVALDMQQITAGHVAALHRVGVKVGNKVTSSVSSYAKLVRDRADFIIARRPLSLTRWVRG